MVSRGRKELNWDLVKDGVVTLESANKSPWYISIVVCQDKIVVIDFKTDKVQLFRLHDGQFLATTDRLESIPRDLCLMDAMTVCVLHEDGLIKMVSIDCTDMSRVLKTTRELRLKGVMDDYRGVARFKNNLVVCGVKQSMMYWCVVSLDDEHVDTIHQICKWDGAWWWCRVTTKDDMFYIACCAGVYDTGVYGFDILSPSQCRYKYKHQHLQQPTSIVVNEDGNIFVCNGFHDDFCIHQLTASCQRVAIFTQEIPQCPCAMFWDNGCLYITCHRSSDITVFTHLYQGVPLEILKMDDRSIQLFEEALKSGKENVYNIRVMVVGHVGVGKTTLIKRLLGEEVDISERQSTDGVDVHVNFCDVSSSFFKWKPRKKDIEQDRRLQRLVKVLIDQTPTRNKAIDEEHAAILPQGVRTDNSANITDKEHVLVSSERDGTLNSYLGAHVSDEKNAEALSTGIHSLHKDFGQNIASTASQEKESNSNAAQTTLTQSETSTMALLKLLKENPDKLKQDAVKNIPMTIWDFAGQYAFYTTHQTFLTRRAIYLLVSDISGQVTDLVDDECFFDSEGIVQCRVHDLIEVWINSIHSCSPSPESGIPPVILVGTHVDKISQKQSPAEGIESETQSMMSDTGAAARKEQSRDSSAISSMQSTAANLNTEDVDVDDESSNGDVEGWESSDKEYDWENGNTDDSESMDTDDVRDKENTEDSESMDIEDTGDLESMDTKNAQKEKVIPRSLLEDMNKAGTVQISKDELDLFLRFQHDIGTILYFSKEVLKMKIVLEPQWMIDALKSLITAEMFVLRNTPAVSKKWFEFKENGKLFPELIDAIWTKDNNPDLFDNRQHILLLMEQMNIIAKPKVYGEDALEVKEENYYLAPCMLRQETPQDVICPKPNPQMETSSVLCYVFTNKFLPSPIFHRLLAACVAHWPLATKKKETVQENQIFCGCCVFQLEQCHKLILHFREYVIFVRVTRMGIKEKTPSSEVCIGAREFITAMLSEIIGCLSQNLRYELFIQCPEYNGVSVNCLFPVSCLQENAEVHCDFHDNIIESCNLLKFWFKEQGQSGDVNAWISRSLGIQDEARVSQAGKMKADIDQTEAVFVLDQLVQRAKSVGIIRSPGTSGTGFRVGPNYIMTAKHVVDKIIQGGPVRFQQQMQHNPHNLLSNRDVYIDFSYERDGVSRDENLRFYFEPVIVYANDRLDTAILKLQPDVKEYPPPLTKFTEVTCLSRGRNGYLIGHSRADIKKTDKYQLYMPLQDEIKTARDWSMQHVNVNGYDGIDNPHCVLLNCTFERGASGAPGFWISPHDGQAYLELMLLCGYPSWYYDDAYTSKTVGIPHSCLIEQGVCMKSIYDDMETIDASLCREIFPQ